MRRMDDECWSFVLSRGPKHYEGSVYIPQEPNREGGVQGGLKL